MNKLILSCFLALSFSFPAHALDDTDESWRKIDPTLGIERLVRTQLPNPPVFDAHFTGSQEKEFILYQWETTCDFSIMGSCIFGGRSQWRRVLVIPSPGGNVAGTGNVDCQGRVILTGWYKMETPSGSRWVQSKATVVSNVPNTPVDDKPIGVLARFEDDTGGHATVKFIHGCNP